MSESRHLELPLPPLGNHRNGFNAVSRRWYPTEETKNFRRLVQLTCLGMTPLEGLIATRVHVVRRPGQRGDIDGYLKCLLDHLQGFAYANDSKIRRLEVEIFEDPEKTPHVDVWLSGHGPPVGKGVELPKAPKPKKRGPVLKPNMYRRKKGER